MKIEIIHIPAEQFNEQINSIRRLILERGEDEVSDRVLNVPEAAAYLDLTESGLRQRVRDCKIPYIKNVYGKITFSKKYLDLALLAPDLIAIENLQKEMLREFGRR